MKKSNTKAINILEFIRDWKAPSLSNNFRPVKIERTVQLLQCADNNEKSTLKSSDFIHLRNYIYNIWRNEGTLINLVGKQLRRSPFIVFSKVDDNKPLGVMEDFTDAYLELLQKLSRPRLIINTLKEFLINYPENWATFEKWLAGMRSLLNNTNSAILNNWKLIHINYGLLLSNGPRNIARSVIDNKDTTADFFTKIGFGSSLLSGVYAQEICKEFLELNGRKLKMNGSKDGIWGKFRDFVIDGSNWRFENCKYLIAESLLKPFISNDPDDYTKNLIQNFLLNYFGDPRIKRSNWLGVQESLRGVLHRWLVGATLKDFFEIIDKTAVDHMWRYRNAFWNAYLMRKYIDDAWVALGSDARRLADRILDNKYSCYGALNSRDQSVLLMRIGSLTIIEWSHNGKCRIWITQTKNTPKLHQPQYLSSFLKNDTCQFDLVHAGAEYYRWQAELSNFIYSKTNLLVTEKEYKLKF